MENKKESMNRIINELNRLYDSEKQVKLYASLHTHSFDVFDSQNTPDKLFKRASELGAEAMAITQHGAVSIVPECIAASKKYGIK